jgi:plasmid replication initiation protein
MTNLITPETNCKVFVKRYAQEFKISEKEASSQFKEIKESLVLQKVEGLEGGFNIVKQIEFQTNNEVTVKFTDEFIDHISLLTKNFTSFDLGEVVGFKKENSFRIYEICKSVAYDSAKWQCTIGVEKLKLMLKLEGKYKLYGSFKRMINECIEEINSQTSITVSLEENKLGRSVAELVFRVKLQESR